jgi:hypothetical protein
MNMRTNDNGIDRDMTQDEATIYLQLVADVETSEAQHQTEVTAQVTAKQSARAKLAELGLDNEEINALIGI